jgi:hypothetical protein
MPMSWVAMLEIEGLHVDPVDLAIVPGVFVSALSLSTIAPVESTLLEAMLADVGSEVFGVTTGRGAD